MICSTGTADFRGFGISCLQNRQVKHLQEFQLMPRRCLVEETGWNYECLETVGLIESNTCVGFGWCKPPKKCQIGSRYLIC